MLGKRYRSISSKAAASKSQVANDIDVFMESQEDEGRDENEDNGDYEPPEEREKGKSYRSDEMFQAMDDLLLLSMLVKGMTPEMKAAHRQKQEEAAALQQLCAEEENQKRVQQWCEDQEIVNSC